MPRQVTSQPRPLVEKQARYFPRQSGLCFPARRALMLDFAFSMLSEWAITFHLPFSFFKIGQPFVLVFLPTLYGIVLPP